MLLLALACMALAAQRIAAFWSYQPALGDPWFVAGGLPERALILERRRDIRPFPGTAVCQIALDIACHVM